MLASGTVIDEDMVLYAQWDQIPVLFTETVPPHETHGGVTVVENVVMAGNTYLNALQFRWGSIGRFTRDPHAFSLHNLGGQFNTISGYIGRTDGGLMLDATITFHGDGVRIDSFEIGATDLPRRISVDITDVRLLRIEVRPNATNTSASSVAFAFANILIS